ncbi:MAG: hypothetical protein GXP29_05975 [Planctomycetes bacterium]|nr:hypothetical protein [Planctomycetota bacterium]
MKLPGRKLMTVVIALGALTVSTGCQSKHKDLVSFLKAHEHEVSAIEYRVGIPDVIEISAPQVLEIDHVRQTIRPDGKISLRLLGPVKVVGMTEKEIAAKIMRLLEPYYEDPKVQVRVTLHRSKKIYLAGQVRSGGGGGGGNQGGGVVADSWTSMPYTGRDTVLDVLAKGSMSFIAARTKVQVIRSSPHEDERRKIVVDIDRMIRTGDTSLNVLLQPNDIVLVPPTPLGWLGLRVQEVLFPFQPVIQAYNTPAGIIDSTDEYTNSDE